jgi:hypothetical protein
VTLACRAEAFGEGGSRRQFYAKIENQPILGKERKIIAERKWYEEIDCHSLCVVYAERIRGMENRIAQ